MVHVLLGALLPFSHECDNTNKWKQCDVVWTHNPNQWHLISFLLDVIYFNAIQLKQISRMRPPMLGWILNANNHTLTRCICMNERSEKVFDIHRVQIVPCVLLSSSLFFSRNRFSKRHWNFFPSIFVRLNGTSRHQKFSYFVIRLKISAEKKRMQQLMN